MSHSLILAITHHQPLESYMRYEKWYHLIGWGVPLVSSCVLLGLHKHSEGKEVGVFGPSVLWCWMGSAWAELR